jgi:hypothetical protein
MRTQNNNTNDVQTARRALCLRPLPRIAVLVMLGLILSGAMTHEFSGYPELDAGGLSAAADMGPADEYLAKITAEIAGHCSCQPPADFASEEIVASAQVQQNGSDKRVAVSTLVRGALSDQMRLLMARKADLERWDGPARARFYKWFGTTSPQARRLIYHRIHREVTLNRRFSTANFRRAVPSRPGIFAFVHPGDPSKVFVDRTFVAAPPLGENSRAGTIVHEMSHFLIVGGTKDYAYGTSDCERLARFDPSKALSNADNFEFYVEGAQ